MFDTEAAHLCDTAATHVCDPVAAHLFDMDLAVYLRQKGRFVEGYLGTDDPRGL